MRTRRLTTVNKNDAERYKTNTDIKKLSLLFTAEGEKHIKVHVPEIAALEMSIAK